LKKPEGRECFLKKPVENPKGGRKSPFKFSTGREFFQKEGRKRGEGESKGRKPSVLKRGKERVGLF
jgi:hypothetical protein